MKLFQYWDRPAPPADVAAWIDEVRAHNPEHEHVLMNEGTAADFIAAHYDDRHLAAFRACGHPAMQADYFRLCAMDAVGGIYLDADMESRQPLTSLLDTAPHALVVTWRTLLNNSILMFRQPGHPFIRACLTLATDNIEHRRFRSVAIATGPAVFNAVRYVAEPLFRDFVSHLLQSDSVEVAALLGNVADPETRAKIDSAAARTGWEEMKELAGIADRIVPASDELTAGYAAMTLMATGPATPWIATAPAKYKDEASHWIAFDQDIYR